MTYAEAIEAALRDSGASLRTVGAALGVSHTYVGEVVRGEKPPFKEDRLAALAAALGLDAAAVARLRVLAAVARGTVDVRGLRPVAVARVLRAIERERARAKGEEAGDG